MTVRSNTRSLVVLLMTPSGVCTGILSFGDGVIVGAGGGGSGVYPIIFFYFYFFFWEVELWLQFQL